MGGRRKVRETAVHYECSVPLTGDPGGAGERPVRKNHYLHQSKLDLAKEILGAKTETEAIEAALDLLTYGEALARGTEAMAGEEYDDVLGLVEDVPSG